MLFILNVEPQNHSLVLFIKFNCFLFIQVIVADTVADKVSLTSMEVNNKLEEVPLTPPGERLNKSEQDENSANSISCSSNNSLVSKVKVTSYLIHENTFTKGEGGPKIEIKINKTKSLVDAITSSNQ